MFGQTINGTVTDASGEPVAFASIMALDKDTALLQGTVADEQGAFRLDVTNATFLRLSSIGYITRTLRLPASETIVLQADSATISEVVVTARRRLTRKTATGIEYDMAANRRAQKESLLQALRYVPLLDVSLGGDLIVMGGQKPRVFLNGKPYEMAEANARQVLESLPASRIKTVKVITEHDPIYGNSHGQYIIDIITERKALDGLYANLTLHGNTQPTTNDGLMVMARKGPLDFSLDYNYSLNGQHHQPMSQELHHDDVSQYLDGKGDGNWQTHLVRAMAKWQIDSLNNLYADVHGHIQDTDLKTSWTTYADDSKLSPVQRLLQRNSVVAGTVETNAIYRNYYRRHPSVERFSLGYAFTYNPDRRHFTNTYRVASGDSIDRERTDGALREHTLNFSYFLPLSRNHSLRWTARQVFRNGSTSSTDLNNIDYTQNITLGTLDYSGSLSPLSFYAALQLDYSNTHMTLPSAEKNRTEDTQFLPSAGLQWSVNRKMSLSLNYGKSVTRPGITQLNPFYNIFSSSYASQGNPNLKPEKRHTLSATMSYMAGQLFMQLSAELNKSNDVIMQYNKEVDSNGRLLSTFDNLGTRRRFGGSLYMSWQPLSVLSLSVYANGHHGKMKSAEVNLDQTFNSYFAQVQASFYLPRNWTLQGKVYSYKSEPSAWSTMNSGQSYSLRIDKSWMKGALRVGFECVSPFAKYTVLEQSTRRNNFVQFQTNYITARSFGLYLSYTFRSGNKVNLQRDRSLKNQDQHTGVD